MRKDTLGKPYLHLKYIIAVFICLTVTANKVLATAEIPGTVVSSCNFEGPYYIVGGKDKIQKDWQNNYEWGKKDITLSIDTGITGAAQKVDIRGINSGAFQFFYTNIRLRNGKYYRVSFKARGEGFTGKMTVMIRNIGGPPYTGYLNRINFKPTQEWEKYSFSGISKVDVDRNIGVMFQTGSLGRFWLDDLKIEEFDSPPAEDKPKPRALVKGNLFPRSSFEGRRDYLWSNGIYTLPEGEWEDPQIYRAEGGKFGKFCMAIPSSKNKGTVFCRSFYIPVAAGNAYTFSVWLKSSKPSANVFLQLLGNDNRSLGWKKIKIDSVWTRYYFTSEILPEYITDAYANITVSQENGIIFADGSQLEAGTNVTPWKAKYPCELYADMHQKNGNIVEWGQKLPLRLMVASAKDDEKLSNKISANLKIIAFPDIVVMDKKIELLLNKEIKMAVDPGRNGLFRVELSAINKELAAPQEMLVARLPKPRPTGKESSFGTHISIRPFFIDYAKKIGIKWIRLHDGSAITKWSCAERDKGEIKWYDTQVNAVIAAGMNILGLPDRAPKWAKLPKGSANIFDLDAFATYCKAIAEHYKGRIDYWEVWNEPYQVGFFPGTAKQYGEVFKVANKALREGNPETKILGFCTSLTGIAYAKKIPAELRKDIDILSFHCYFSNLTGGGSIFANSEDSEVNAYKKLFGKDDPGIYWNTEGNNGSLSETCFYSFLEDKSLNDQAAAFCSRVWVEQRKENISKLFIYTLHQGDTIKHAGNYNTLIGFDRSITPGATSTAVTAWCIDGLMVQPHTRSENIVQGLFSGSDRSVWVVFKDPLAVKSSKLNLDDLPADIQVIDVMGNDPRQDNIKEYEIGIKPLFVIMHNDNTKKLLEICHSILR